MGFVISKLTVFVSRFEGIYKDVFAWFVASIVVMLVLLGNWQLSRASDKKAMLSSFLEEPAKYHLDEGSSQLSHPYMKVAIDHGHWLPQGFVKQNVVRNNKLGAQVYGLFCQSEVCMIVNRGWVSNQNMDAIKLPDDRQKQIVGMMRVLPYTLIREKEYIDFKKGFASIVSLDVDFVSALINKTVVKNELLLIQKSGTYQRDVVIPKVTVARHYGYAIQFYLLALVFVFGYIYTKK